MSEHNQDDKLTIEDFSASPAVSIDVKVLRDLIEGLRALPNVSDMAVIKTVTELDRIASFYERAMDRRQKILDRGLQIGEERVKAGTLRPEIFDLMKRVGGIPPDIMTQVLDEAGLSESCQCERCTARRAEKAEQERGGARLQ